MRQPNLPSMASYLDRLAFTHKGDFERSEKQLIALKNLTYADLKKDTISLCSRNNKNRIAILVKGKLPEDKMFEYQEISVEALKNKATSTSRLE